MNSHEMALAAAMGEVETARAELTIREWPDTVPGLYVQPVGTSERSFMWAAFALMGALAIVADVVCTLAR